TLPLLGQGNHGNNWAEQSSRGFKVHASQRSARMAGMVVCTHCFFGRLPQPLARPYPVGVGVSYVRQRRTINHAQLPIGAKAAGLEKFAAKAVRCCLETHMPKETELSRLRNVFVWLISDRRMSRLHRQFLGQMGPTDVLTFQHGEIFISVETAKRHARTFGNS